MPRVVVIGGANVDVKGHTSAPAIPATSNPGTVVVSAGGVGRNIAHNLALLGVETALVAMVGDDDHAALIARQSQAAGVDVSMLIRSGDASGTYLALLDHDGELISAINAMACADAMTPEMLNDLTPRMMTADLLVADCNLPLNCLAWLSEFSTRQAKRLLIEPVSVPKSQKLKQVVNLRAFAATPNRDQAEAVSGTRKWPAAAAAIHALGFANVVIHAGAEGAYVSEAGSTQRRVPAISPAKVNDVTGAGDAAVAGLVWGLVSGYDIFEAARFGQAAAALKLESSSSVADVMTQARLLLAAKVSG